MAEIRVHIPHYLLFEMGVSATEAYCHGARRKVVTHLPLTPGYQRTRSGDKSLEDRPRSRRPSEEDLDALRSLVEADPSATTHSLVATLHCSNDAVDKHHHSFGKVLQKGS